MIIGVCLSQFWFIIIFPIKIAIWVYAPFWSVIYFRNYFLVRFSFILDSCFLLFLLLCFSASPLFDFPASLLFLLLPFLLLCFSAFCFSCFSVSLLFCFCAFLLLLFLFLQSCVFAALLLAAPLRTLLLCFLSLLSFCFSFSFASFYCAKWKVNMPKCGKYHAKWHVLVPNCCKCKANTPFVSETIKGKQGRRQVGNKW